MLKKTALVIASLFFLLMSSSANAVVDNTSEIPELNPFCWRRAECYKIRNKFITPSSDAVFDGTAIIPELEEGFITDDSVAPCNTGTGAEQWGRCLPVGTSKTEISFGGKSEFSNIGEFILLMYKYLLTIASIVAVIVIIISGAQWITSGGNSEAIGSAKKRIGGAIIGLFIAYMSYFVLNTINPALVNLRLPQVWMARPQNLMPEYCSDIEGASEGRIKFMYAGSKTTLNKPITFDTAEGKNEGFKWTKPKEEPKFACGDRFFAEGGGKLDCKGGFCPSVDENQQTCFEYKGDKTDYRCGNVRIGGFISNSRMLKPCNFISAIIEKFTDRVSPWNCPPIVDSKLVVVCNKNNYEGNPFDHEFGAGHGENTNHYRIEYESSKVKSYAESVCAGSKGGVKGFIMVFEMSKSLGSNQYDYVGRGGKFLGQAQTSGVGDVAPRRIGPLGLLGEVFDSKYLFTFDEIEKGVRMDVDAADIPAY